MSINTLLSGLPAASVVQVGGHGFPPSRTERGALVSPTVSGDSFEQGKWWRNMAKAESTTEVVGRQCNCGSCPVCAVKAYRAQDSATPGRNQVGDLGQAAKAAPDQTVAATLAPANPSSQDRKVAAKAAIVITDASQELQMIRLEQAKSGVEKGENIDRPDQAQDNSSDSAIKSSGQSLIPTAGQRAATAALAGLGRPLAQFDFTA